MDIYTATEVSWKNGYTQGYLDAMNGEPPRIEMTSREPLKDEDDEEED